MKKLIIIISTLSIFSLIFSESVLELGEIDVNNGTVEILISTDTAFTGFQFDINGIELDDEDNGTGGLAEEYGFDIYAAGDTALGFSLTGGEIPAGSNGVLTILSGTISNVDNVCLPFVENVGPEEDTPILSDAEGIALLDVSIGAGCCDEVCHPLGVENDITFSILKTYPNPFNPELNIDVSIEDSGMLDIAIYNLNGQIIETIYNDYAYANQLYNLKWKASSKISSGIYIVKASTPNSQFSSIVNLLK
tara:strand:+ start:328 stop:1077 length:750 start_codon:yes stop_codon:yes gene_type:complete